jgi:hypothetical protein
MQQMPQMQPMPNAQPPGPPQVNPQRDAITMALMGISNPDPRKQLPMLPQNVSQGMGAIGNAIGSMGQPQQPPGPPMSLAPPPPQATPMPPAGAPVGASGPPPQLPQGPEGLY